jgi:hypothetical protein
LSAELQLNLLIKVYCLFYRLGYSYVGTKAELRIKAENTPLYLQTNVMWRLSGLSVVMWLSPAFGKIM